MIGNLHLQHRVIRPGDAVALLVEVNGPGGMYTEVGRTAVVGRASQQLLEEFEFAAETQRRTVDQLVAGAAPAEIWASHNDWMREHGLPEEGRIHCHGQGYDFVERPLIRSDEPMTIEAGMNITCHPSYVRSGRLGDGSATTTSCERTAPPEPLHAFPRRIVEV